MKRALAVLRALTAPYELLPRLPEPGTAWCVGCSLNGYRTNVMRADKISGHLRYHRAGRVRVKIAQERTAP